MRKAVAGVLAVFMCLFIFTGCFNDRTLEQIVTPQNIEEAKKMAMDQPDFAKSFRAVDVEFDGNNVTCKYYLKETFDASQLTVIKTRIETSGYEKQILALKDKVEKDLGIRPEKLTYEFYTNGGQIITTIEG